MAVVGPIGLLIYGFWENVVTRRNILEYLSRSNLYNNYWGSVNSISNEHPVLPGAYGPAPYGPPAPYGGAYGPAYGGYGGY